MSRESFVRKAARIGGTLFGPIPAGHNREFFCLDEHTWVWHEEWTDESGQHQSVTTRYDVQPDGITKLQDGHASQPLSYEETHNLYQSTQLYVKHIAAEYQRMLHTA